MEAAFVSLLVVIIMCICLTTTHHMGEEAKRYKRCYDNELEQNIKLMKELHNLKLENMQLKDQLLLKSFYKTNNKSVADNDLLYAVKYAMKKAHPDNGGKQEDFIKFNNLYNKIRN